MLKRQIKHSNHGNAMGMPWDYSRLKADYRHENSTRLLQCSQNVDVTAPNMDPTSSWLLPRSTAIGWLNEEDTISVAGVSALNFPAAR